MIGLSKNCNGPVVVGVWIYPNCIRSIHLRCSVKKGVLKISQNSLESICTRVSFLIKLQAFVKKETLAQAFSREFREISKNTFFTEHLWATASVSE